MVYGIYNYSYWGEFKPTYILGASHCRLLDGFLLNVSPEFCSWTVETRLSRLGFRRLRDSASEMRVLTCYPLVI